MKKKTDITMRDAKAGRTGERGIMFEKGRKSPYRVAVYINKKQKTIGWFKTLEDAVECRDKFLSEK